MRTFLWFMGPPAKANRSILVDMSGHAAEVGKVPVLRHAPPVLLVLRVLAPASHELLAESLPSSFQQLEISRNLADQWELVLPSSIPTPSTSSPPRPRASVSPCLPLGKSVMSTSTTPLWATRVSRFSILTARAPPIQFGLLACTALNGAHLGFGHLCCQCRVYTPRLWSYKVACAV